MSRLRLNVRQLPRLKRPSRPAGHQIRLLGAVFVLLLATLAGGAAGGWLESRHSGDNVLGGNLAGQKRVVTKQSQLISQIARNVGPSVVSVNVAIGSSGGFGLFGFAQPSQEQAAGTGIIISSSGLIITNRHVVPAGTSSVSVTLSDGSELKDVSVIGRTGANDMLDVAFLKINNTEGHKLPAATIGDSSAVQVGDNVIAIGNALGQFQNTVTSGIISGYGRSVQADDGSGSASVENLDDLFQTDAAINEGNSGGPLVNLNGQVIGINTAIAGDGAQNIGFAIPINDVRGLIDQVVKTGKFARPYLGIRYVALTADVAKEYGLSAQIGAFIAPSDDPANSSVITGSPAAKAGLQEQDIILAVNSAKIDSTHSLTSRLGTYRPGDTIQLTILRGNKTLNLKAILGSLPSS